MNKHDARDDEQSQKLIWLPWRVGRRVPRNIYAQLGKTADDDDMIIGQMDSEMIAAEAVACHNETLPHR